MAEKENSISIKNRKAFHDFLVIEKMEAGLVLVGCEVKSIRNQKVQLNGSFVRELNGELWLMGTHISPYEEGNRFNPDPLRDRKLLVHKKEIKKWSAKVAQKGFTIIPLGMYLARNKVKVTIALCQAKKSHDKRATKKEKDINREIDRRGKW